MDFINIIGYKVDKKKYKEMESVSEKIKSAYKGSKDIYDDMLTKNKLWSKIYIRVFWNMDFLEIAEKILKMIPENFSGSLLDVPCGTINLTLEYYSKLKDAEIEALDYTEEMLEIARDRVSRLELENINIVEGDVADLPYEDEYFDIVTSMNGFHSFPDKDKSYSETARVLKKGGMFCGCHYIRGEYGITDFVVKALLTKRGWFSPPFQTKEEAFKVLSSYYSEVELFNDKAIMWFRCIK